MYKHKIGVLWTNGNYEGFVGEGRTPDLAIEDAVRQVMKKSDSKGCGFKLIKEEDIKTVVKDGQETIKRHWRLLNDPDDSQGYYWP
jgi:hypothetical protein